MVGWGPAQGGHSPGRDTPGLLTPEAGERSGGKLTLSLGRKRPLLVLGQEEGREEFQGESTGRVREAQHLVRWEAWKKGRCRV